MVLRVIKILHPCPEGPMDNGASIGQDHFRQRRIISPAFGSSEARAQIPVFRHCARQVNSVSARNMASPSYSVQEFKDRTKSLGAREVNIPEFLSPAVLHALGLAAFNYDFRGDGEDRAEFFASLRDFMCVHIPKS